MDCKDQKLTNTNAVIDDSNDSSDLLSMLKVIWQLYDVSRAVLSSHAAAAVLVSMSIEIQTLLTKLRVMRQRWETHLPFKEASTVDFVSWSKWAEELASNMDVCSPFGLRSSSTVPSNHCLIDLYHEAKQILEGAAEQVDLNDPLLLVRYHSEMQTSITRNREQSMDSISQLSARLLNETQGLDVSALGDLAAMRATCSTLLTQLSEELYQMNEQQVKIFNPQDYERLAIRILYEPEYEGRIAMREARDVMHNWRNGVPTGKLEEYRREQIEKTKEEIRQTKHGVKLEQYVNFDEDFSGQLSEFGRFLFNRRRNITREELRQLIHLVYCVFYYQSDEVHETERQQPEPSAADAAEVCPPLPVEFTQKLRDSKAAANCLYVTLKRIEPYINNSGIDVPGSTYALRAKYKDWSWCHVQMAFERLDFLSKNSGKAAFAKFINSLFPHRKTNSVKRALYRNDNVNSFNIVADVVKEFNSVLSLLG